MYFMLQCVELRANVYDRVCNKSISKVPQFSYMLDIYFESEKHHYKDL